MSSTTPSILNALKSLPPDELRTILKRLPKDEQAQVVEMLEELEARQSRDVAQNDFLAFVRHVWPEFIIGSHHRRMAKLFERIARGECKRLIINMPPRHGKSELGSRLFPAWFLGKFPNKQIIQASHTAELAVKFGRSVRNLIDSEAYRDVFPDVALRADSKAAGRWNTDANGIYFAVGVGGAVAGMGADLCLGKNTICIIDDSKGPREACISDVEAGSWIKTINGWERVKRKKLTIHDKYIRLNNDVACSKEHRFLTNRGWKMASELRVGDRILTKTIWSILWYRINKVVNGLRNPLQEKRGRA